jgi:hypothetical protein
MRLQEGGGLRRGSSTVQWLQSSVAIPAACRHARGLSLNPIRQAGAITPSTRDTAQSRRMAGMEKCLRRLRGAAAVPQREGLLWSSCDSGFRTTGGKMVSQRVLLCSGAWPVSGAAERGPGSWPASSARRHVRGTEGVAPQRGCRNPAACAHIR